MSGHLTFSGRRRLAIAATAALLAAGAARPAGAASTFSPFATVGYQYDSNLFLRPGIDPALGITALGDSILDYEAGLDSRLDWGPDRLTLDAEGTRDQYSRFAYLDHTEYRVLGDLAWRLGPIVDGTASYQQTRYMAAFNNTLSTALLLNTEKTANATARVLVTPEWRLDLTPELHRLDTPVPGFPDFRLAETIGIAGLDYLGFGRLTAGLRFTDDSGRYSGIEDATRYEQRDTDLTASYKVSGFSTFNASAGYTSRNTETNPAGSPAGPLGGTATGYAGVLGTTSSVTGSLTYQRQLTGKTSASLTFFRRVDSYAAGANPEIGTGGAVGATWKADVKFTVGLNYSLAREQIEGAVIVVNTSNLSETTQVAQLDVHYAALSWLTIRPYVSWQKADSNDALETYSATLVGIDVTGRLDW